MADTRKYIAAGAKRLAQSISATDTTIELSDVNSRDGSALTMTDFGTLGYATIEPQSSSKFELISFTGISGTSLTGVTRGLKFEADYTQDVSLRKTHAAGATVIFSNSPQFYDNFVNKNNDETITGTYTFTSTAIPIFDADPTLTDDKHIATKKYADDLAIAGAPDSTATVKGIVEKATSAETQSGTDSGGTTAPLFAAPSDIAANVQNQQHTYAADSGAADAYVITLSPAPSAYAAGQKFTFLATNANTGASTLNVNSLGAATILKHNDQALEANDIEAGSIVEVVYNGTQFEMQTPVATNLSAAVASEATTFFGATDITGAEAETLTDGSDASTLHYHDMYEQVKASLTNDALVFLFGMGDNMVEVETTNGVVNRTPLNTNLYVTGGGSDAALKVSSDINIGLGEELEGDSIDFDDNPNISMAFSIEFDSTTNQDFFLGISQDSNLAAAYANATTTQRHAGFMVEDATLYASIADGSTQERTDVTAGITLTDENLYEIVYTGGTNCVFNVNGTTVATLSTNMPTGTNGIYFYIFFTGVSGNHNCRVRHPGAIKLTNVL